MRRWPSGCATRNNGGSRHRTEAIRSVRCSPWDVWDRFFLVVPQVEFRIHAAPRRLTSVRILLNFGFKYVSHNLIRSPCSMEDLTGAPRVYQEVHKSFRKS